ncbi:MAG: hypothetical protein ACE5G8_18380, partial [Anaerolineae bacterium]
PALSPTDWYGGTHPAFSSVDFYRRSFRYYAADPARSARLRKAFDDGAWLAVHTCWRRPCLPLPSSRFNWLTFLPLTPFQPPLCCGRCTGRW